MERIPQFFSLLGKQLQTLPWANCTEHSLGKTAPNIGIARLQSQRHEVRGLILAPD